jgi:hypothetical protein
MMCFNRSVPLRQTAPDHPIPQYLRRLIRTPTFAVVVSLLSASIVESQQARVSEYDVKAVYLYNFAKFVDWPVSAMKSKGDPFTICVLGKDPFGSILDVTIAGETIGGRRVAAKRVSDPPEVSGCQILYISSSEESRLNTIFGYLDKSATLTVSDIPQFSQHGGMIEFVLQGSRVRFDVNLAAAQQAGLNLSSELLKVATNVRRDARPGE